VVIAAAALLSFHFQLLPLQILFINLITDLLPAVALGVTKGGADIMKLKPRNASEPIIDKDRWKLIFFYSIVIAAMSTIGVLVNHFNFHSGTSLDAAVCNNILFFTLIFSQLLHVFNMGSGPFFNNEVIRNKYVWYSVIASLAILFGVIQITYVREALNIVPMGMREWLIILSSSIGSIVIIQVARSLKLFKSNEYARAEQHKN
jgi:Ca2+-transporting ATPase